MKEIISLEKLPNITINLKNLAHAFLGLIERMPKIPGKLLPIALLSSIFLAGCSPRGVVTGVEIDPKSVCNSPPITVPINPQTTGVILFGNEFTVHEGVLTGFGVNPNSGELVAENVGDPNGDGYLDHIKATFGNGQITASLICATGQNTESNR